MPPARSVALLALLAGPAAAEPAAATFEAVYTADLIAPLRGGGHSARFLDNLDLVVDVDLAQLAGWRGARLHVYGLNNSGGEPNARLGTLEGVDNIEVSRPRARLYELWLEQDFGGRASARAGLYDLNSEFYVTPSSDALINPSFGIGPELSATGPNGPSIFPSTALAFRLRAGFSHTGYAQFAVLNADAATLGDPGGVRTGFGHGALAIAEAGTGERTRLSVGAWRYTRRQEAVRPAGAEARSQGAYVLAEHRIAPDGRTTIFVRAGLSDGDTTPFGGAWQAGFTVTPAFPSRPQSTFSVGAHQALISDKYRRNAAEAGTLVGRSETGIELTYSDRVAPWLTMQPDLQYIRRPGGVLGARDEVIAGLRFIADLTGGPWMSRSR